MKKCTHFYRLLHKIEEYTDDVKLIESNAQAIGSILGCKFRLYQEVIPSKFHGDISNLGDEDYRGFLCIKDDSEKATTWPTFYSVEALDKWYYEHAV